MLHSKSEINFKKTNQLCEGQALEQHIFKLENLIQKRQYKNNDNKECKQLIEAYIRAVEYYSSINDPKFCIYKEKIIQFTKKQNENKENQDQVQNESKNNKDSDIKLLFEKQNLESQENIKKNALEFVKNFESNKKIFKSDLQYQLQQIESRLAQRKKNIQNNSQKELVTKMNNQSQKFIGNKQSVFHSIKQENDFDDMIEFDKQITLYKGNVQNKNDDREIKQINQMNYLDNFVLKTKQEAQQNISQINSKFDSQIDHLKTQIGEKKDCLQYQVLQALISEKTKQIKLIKNNTEQKLEKQLIQYKNQIVFNCFQD